MNWMPVGKKLTFFDIYSWCDLPDWFLDKGLNGLHRNIYLPCINFAQHPQRNTVGSGGGRELPLNDFCLSLKHYNCFLKNNLLPCLNPMLFPSRIPDTCEDKCCSTAGKYHVKHLRAVVPMRKLHQWRSIISICEASVPMRYISSAPVRNMHYLWVNWFEWKMSEIHSHRQCKILMDNNGISDWFDDVQPHSLWKIRENLECNQHWPCLHHTMISFWTFRYQLLWE